VMRRGPNIRSWYHDAPYGAYSLRDCKIVLSMNDPSKLAEALDSAALRALVGIDRYAERERYAEAVALVLSDYTFEDVSARLDAAEIWFERIQSYDQLADDRQALHLGAFMDVDAGGRQTKIVSHPLRYDGAAPGLRRMPLTPGCDSRGILLDHGFAPAEVDALVAEGVVAEPVAIENTDQQTQPASAKHEPSFG
jgi:crotonobetainyl-CoA:carnitine CoA-transferase CaiB-like acyl-CoA transferase